MAKVYTDRQDELTIDAVLRRGLRVSGTPKWAVLRLALARSLRISTPPDEALDRRESAQGGGEYALEQLAGEGKGDEDFTPLFCALLSVYHDLDLFADDENFTRLLQRHIRRGLREFRTSWLESHDFHEYLSQELFSDVHTAEKADDGMSQTSIRLALSEIGVSGEIVEQLDGPRLTRFHVRLRDAKDLDVLERGLEKLAFTLGLGEAGVFLVRTQEPKVAALDVPRPPSSWKQATGHDLRQWLALSPSEWRLPVYLGQDVIGKPFGFDLAATPHLLVGGTTGSGKSVCLHAIILSLLSRLTPDRLNLCLIDPKRVEFAPYRDLPHLYGGEIFTDARDSNEVLKKLVTLMEQRELALAEADARDIDAPAAKSFGWPRILVVVEELADLFMQSGAIEEPLVRLAQKARATGIHLVLATQRPDAQTFSGLLRSNVPSRIALTVQKSAESRIILDENGAEKLLGKGDMLIRLIGTQTRRVHGVLIDSDEIALSVAKPRMHSG